MANTLETLRSAIGKIEVRTNGELGYDEVKVSIDDAWREILNMHEWSFTKNVNELAIATIAPKSAGTISITTETTAITGSGTAFASGDVGSFIMLDDQPYLISAFSSTTSITLDKAYQGGTLATGTKYTLFKNEYTLDGDVYEIMSMVGPDWPLEERSISTLNILDPDRNVSGEPIYWAYTAVDSSGDQQIELWPTPNDNYHLPYVGMKRSALTTASQVIADISPTLLHRAAGLAWLNVAAKAYSADKMQKFNSARQIADDWNKQYAGTLESLIVKDHRRMGHNDRHLNDALYRLSGRSDLDLFK